MAYTEYHPEESEEDGDQDQFDLGSSFDDLEPGYFENQTHLPADIHAKNEAEYDEQYEEEFGSDEDWYEDSDDEIKIDPNNEWSEAIKELRLCKEKLDRITKEKKSLPTNTKRLRVSCFVFWILITPTPTRPTITL